MAYDFTNLAADTMTTTDVGGVTAAPLTLAAWFNPDALAQGDGILTIGASSTEAFQLNTNTSSEVAALTIDNTAAAGTSAGTYTTGTWHHGAAVFASTTSRTAYLNGVAGTANTTSKAPDAPTAIIVGARTTGGGNPFEGAIAEAAIWNVALSASEIAALAKGLSPLFVRRSALIFYMPLVRNKVNLRGVSPTNGSTSVIAHPRILKPQSPTIGMVIASAPPVVAETPAVQKRPGPYPRAYLPPGKWKTKPKLETAKRIYELAREEIPETEQIGLLPPSLLLKGRDFARLPPAEYVDFEALRGALDVLETLLSAIREARARQIAFEAEQERVRRRRMFEEELIVTLLADLA